MWGRKPRPVTTSVVQLSKTRTKRKRRKNDARRVSSPRERRERSHERLVALRLLARRFFSLVSTGRARQPRQRARLTVRICTHRERERFFFLFFFVGKNGPFREIPSRREEILEALFLAAEIVVSDVKIRAKRRLMRRNGTTTTPAFFKKCTRRENKLLRRPWRDIPPKTRRRRPKSQHKEEEGRVMRCTVVGGDDDTSLPRAAKRIRAARASRRLRGTHVDNLSRV